MAFLSASLATFALSITPAYAFTSFQPNCTLPHVSYNYITAPSVRSTLDIAWSSLATIIACTFTVLHLNVPEQRDGRDPGWKGSVKWWWRGIEPTLRWTVVTIVAPEWYAMTAIDGYLDARRTRGALRLSLKGRQPSGGWSLIHAFYINMGGYAVRLPGKEDSDYRYSSADDRGTLTHLSGNSFCTLLSRDTHELDRLPSDGDIADRSKSDALAKCLALIQVIYFCAQCITRAIRSLPVSPLEIGTLGFALCSFVSYGFLFNKPRSVKSATVLSTSIFDMDPYIRRAIQDEKSDRDGYKWKVIVSNDAAEPKLTTWILPPLALVFGAIHIAAWNFPFPTLIEIWLWRVCTVFAMASIPIGYYIGLLPGLRKLMEPSEYVALSIGIYGVARLVIIGVMARSVFYLEPASFVTTWASNLPHVG